MARSGPTCRRSGARGFPGDPTRLSRRSASVAGARQDPAAGNRPSTIKPLSHADIHSLRREADGNWLALVPGVPGGIAQVVGGTAESREALLRTAAGLGWTPSDGAAGSGPNAPALMVLLERAPVGELTSRFEALAPSGWLCLPRLRPSEASRARRALTGRGAGCREYLLEESGGVVRSMTPLTPIGKALVAAAATTHDPGRSWRRIVRRILDRLGPPPRGTTHLLLAARGWA